MRDMICKRCGHAWKNKSPPDRRFISCPSCRYHITLTHDQPNISRLTPIDIEGFSSFDDIGLKELVLDIQSELARRKTITKNPASTIRLLNKKIHDITARDNQISWIEAHTSHNI